MVPQPRTGHTNPVDSVVFSPRCYGGPRADIACYGEPAGWSADGDTVGRLHPARRREDDDWGQASTMVREVMDAAARTKLVNNIPVVCTYPVIIRPGGRHHD